MTTRSRCDARIRPGLLDYGPPFDLPQHAAPSDRTLTSRETDDAVTPTTGRTDGNHTPMPTKRALLAELTSHELRANVDYYELEVSDHRVRAQLIDALARSRKTRIDETLYDLSRDRLKELCRAFDLDDSGRKKVDLVARLVLPTATQDTEDAVQTAAASPVAEDARGQAPESAERRAARDGTSGRPLISCAGRSTAATTRPTSSACSS